MSWRTHGFYKGLSKSARKWLKAFDRHWDTKAEGRTREDAYDHLADECSPTAIKPKSRRVKLADLPAPEPADPAGEANEVKLLAKEVARFTVPRRTRRGWTIHLILRSGEKVRARFDDEESARDAYKMLIQASSILTAA